MKAQELSRKYATAIFSQALEPWLISLTSVKDRLVAEPALVASLQDSAQPFGERQSVLDSIIPEDSDRHVRNFLNAMLKEGDIALLGDVVADLDKMTRGGPLVEVALVTTSFALSDEEQEQFRQKLREGYGEHLEFVFGVDPAIVGGAVVQVGDKVIDGSVATRLDTMGNLLGVK